MGAKPAGVCPIAASLDLFGDRWSLVLVRDLVMGKRRFNDFLEAAEGIKRNVLAERLKRFEAAGLVERRAYQDNPPRYEYLLTAAGADLVPIIQSIARWGERHFGGVLKPPVAFYSATPSSTLAASGGAPAPRAKRAPAGRTRRK